MTGKRIASIARARLLATWGDWPRFTLVRAPAGFGKSELFDQLEQHLPTVGDNVCRLVLPFDRPDAVAMFAGAAGADPAAGYPALREAFAGRGRCAILIDDADGLVCFPGAAALLERLSGDLPDLRIVLASRGDTALPLARHRAAGNVLELGPRQLLFDRDEQRELFEVWNPYRIPPHQREQMALAIGGWPCGFGLQFQGLESGMSGRSGRALEGGWRIVSDYFEQEVMGALPEDLRDYLQRASVLERISAGDCDLLFGDDRGRAMLARAHNLGAPLWPTDPEHDQYAILPLFAHFLRSRLPRREAAALGLRAARMLKKRGCFREACIQALAFGDHEMAAELLERQLKADFALRDEAELLLLADRIEASVRERHPFILLARAQAFVFRFEFAQARQHLESARALAAGRGAQADPEEAQTLEMLLLHREMVLALGQQELSRAQECGDRLLRNMEQVPPMQRVMILNSLTYAQQELYIFRGAERYYVQAKKLIPELDSWISSVPLETFYARHLFQTGRTPAAIELLEDMLARLIEELGAKPVLGSIAAIVLAEMKFETNALDEAAQLLADYGSNMEEFGFLPVTLATRILEARLHMARGEHERGFAVLERPFVGAGELFDKMSRALTVERIYWLLRLGRVDAAKLACAGIGLSLTRPPEPHSSAASAEEAFATAWIQLARANRRIDDAIHLAQKWQRYTEGVGAIRSNVRWNVILASLQVLAGEPSLATRYLRRAVLLGAGGLHRSAFLAEIDVLKELCAKLVASDLGEVERGFVASLLQDSLPGEHLPEQQQFSVPLGAFSSRETAILRLVAKGMLNREIGDALGMTEGTVKWYLQRIYDKLGIRRRSQVAMLVSQWHTGPAEERQALH